MHARPLSIASSDVSTRKYRSLAVADAIAKPLARATDQIVVCRWSGSSGIAVHKLSRASFRYRQGLAQLSGDTFGTIGTGYRFQTKGEQH
jgi:hypothetical protein